MSVVVALKFKDGVIIGSDRRVTTSYHTYQDDAATKIHMTQYSNHDIGTVGYLRTLNVISTVDEFMEYKDILDGDKVDFKYLVKTIVPKLIKTLENNRILDELECTSNSNFIYATNEKIFTIGGDFAVIEHPYWAAVGCGQDLVAGLLSVAEPEDFENMDAENALGMIEGCISKACKSDNAISEEFDFFILRDGDYVTNLFEYMPLDAIVEELSDEEIEEDDKEDDEEIKSILKEPSETSDNAGAGVQKKKRRKNRKSRKDGDNNEK